MTHLAATEELLKLERYIARLEVLIVVCIALFVLGLVGLAWLIFNKEGE